MLRNILLIVFKQFEESIHHICISLLGTLSFICKIGLFLQFFYFYFYYEFFINSSIKKKKMDKINKEHVIWVKSFHVVYGLFVVHFVSCIAQQLGEFVCRPQDKKPSSSSFARWFTVNWQSSSSVKQIKWFNFIESKLF